MNLRISPFSKNYFPTIGFNVPFVAATAITVLAIAILYKLAQYLLTRNAGSFPPPNNPSLQLDPSLEKEDVQHNQPSQLDPPLEEDLQSNSSSQLDPSLEKEDVQHNQPSQLDLPPEEDLQSNSSSQLDPSLEEEDVQHNQPSQLDPPLEEDLQSNSSSQLDPSLEKEDVQHNQPPQLDLPPEEGLHNSSSQLDPSLEEEDVQHNQPPQLGPPPEVDLQDFEFLNLPVDIQKLIASYVPNYKFGLVNKHLSQVFYSNIFQLISDDCQKIFSKNDIQKCDFLNAKGQVNSVIKELESFISEFPNGSEYLASINPNQYHPFTYWKMLKRYLLDTRAIHTSLYTQFIQSQNTLISLILGSLYKDAKNFNQNLYNHATQFRTWLQSRPSITSLRIPSGTLVEQENWNLKDITHLKIVISEGNKDRCIQLSMDSLQRIPGITELTLSQANWRSESSWACHDKSIELSSNYFLNLKTDTITTLNLQGIQIADLNLSNNLNIKKINISCDKPWSEKFLSLQNITHLQLTCTHYTPDPISNFTDHIFSKLESLKLTNFKIKTHEIIQNMNLKELKFNAIYTEDLNFLNAYPNLTSLELKDITILPSLKEEVVTTFRIRELKALLSIPVKRGVNSIAFDNLIKLENLTIHGFETISGLDKLEKLESLSIDNFSKAVQDQVVSIAHQLTYLKLSIDGLEDLNEEIAKKITKISLFSCQSHSKIDLKVSRILTQYNHSLTIEYK